MGACSSTNAKMNDIVADGKAAAAKMNDQREAAAAKKLEAATENLTLDSTVTANKEYLRDLQDALSAVIIEYQRTLDGSAVAAALRTPHLSIWAKSDAFCGNAEGAKALHLSAARIDLIACGFADFLGDPSTDTLDSLKEAKDEIRGALSSIDAYLKAEIKLAAELPKAAAATEKVKAKEAEVKAAADAEDEKAEKRLEKEVEKLEKEQEKLQDAADDARAEADSTKKEALQTSKAAMRDAAALINTAFKRRAQGYTALGAAISAAAKASAATPKIREYEPADATTSLTAFAKDVALKGQAATQAATRADLPKETTLKLAEAKRLLTLTSEAVQRWAKEDASTGISTLHGPKSEGGLLAKLSAALSDASGAAAKESVEACMLRAEAPTAQKACASACEAFVREAKRFQEGLSAVAETLKAFEAATGAEGAQRGRMERSAAVKAAKESAAAAFKRKEEDEAASEAEVVDESEEAARARLARLEAATAEARAALEKKLGELATAPAGKGKGGLVPTVEIIAAADALVAAVASYANRDFAPVELKEGGVPTMDLAAYEAAEAAEAEAEAAAKAAADEAAAAAKVAEEQAAAKQAAEAAEAAEAESAAKAADEAAAAKLVAESEAARLAMEKEAQAAEAAEKEAAKEAAAKEAAAKAAEAEEAAKAAQEAEAAKEAEAEAAKAAEAQAEAATLAAAESEADEQEAAEEDAVTNATGEEATEAAKTVSAGSELGEKRRDGEDDYLPFVTTEVPKEARRLSLTSHGVTNTNWAKVDGKWVVAGAA